jgi:adsorption protein B
MFWDSAFAATLVAAKLILILVAVSFFVSGLDDFFVDCVHLLRSFYRRLFVYSKHQRLTVDHLCLPKEQPLALMIPAWDESVVIGKMLENTLRSVNYGNYHVFVGTYQNDPATHREVHKVREQYENVHLIVCPKDGPTNKADCLNWVYQGILSFEQEAGFFFNIFAIQDAEDIVHPLSLKLFNYLIPRKDMVQLPVFPLEREWYQFTASHYIDEFSECHSKDLPVREVLSGSIPSAGVGCAFSRKVLMELAARNDNRLFSIHSLTEDYEIGLKLAEIEDSKQIFVKQAIKRKVTRTSRFTGKQREKEIDEYIATREYFPSNLRAVVRQKSRWVLGIALQGWASIGWSGGLWTKYMLFRDRKALLTNLINFLGYVLLSLLLLIWIGNKASPGYFSSPGLVVVDSWLWYIIIADTFFLLVRLLQRAFAVRVIYGWFQALLSIPRQIWLNVINFLATSRAIFLYSRYLATGELVSWDKTDHVFPTPSELKSFRRKLGELLLEKRFIRVDQLDKVLEIQKYDPRPLGAILVSEGYVTEGDLLQVLGTQFQVSSRALDPFEIPLDVIEMVPSSVAVKYNVFPLDRGPGSSLVLATDNLLSKEDLWDLEETLGRRIEFELCTRSDLAFSLRYGYDRLAVKKSSDIDRIGRFLLRENLISELDLQEALSTQRSSYKRLGDILVKQGAIRHTDLQRALQSYTKESHGLLGAYLVQNDYVTLDQLESALTEQEAGTRKLGEILVDRGVVSRAQLDEVFLQESS